jgi:protocatechuate 3,4-dioxygenase beta subunit
MKNVSLLFCLIFVLSFNTTISAQESANSSMEIPLNYKNRNALYDYYEKQLNNVDTVPDYTSKLNKIKISGTIYQSDGKTPAKDVILFIHQPNEDGDYILKRDANRKRYVYHRAWIKTDTDGKYTFYTFIPGKYDRSKELKQIHRTIKEPGKEAYELVSFFFDDDPLLPELTLACRARAVGSMLRLQKQDSMYVATRDIKLPKSIVLDQ